MLNAENIQPTIKVDLALIRYLTEVQQTVVWRCIRLSCYTLGTHFIFQYTAMEFMATVFVTI